MKIGIYKIVSPDGSVYIGQSVDMEKRFAQHRRNRSKDYSKLKSSFNYYGPYNHRFEILEECKTKELNERERYWFNHYSEMGCDMLNSVSIPSGVTKKGGRTKWVKIPRCENFVIGSNGKVKRLKHRSTGKLYRILDEMMVEPQVNNSKVAYVNITTNEGKQKVFALQKLVVKTFLTPGRIYYKTADNPLINSVNVFIDSEDYTKMNYKPQIFKTIKT